MPGLNQQVNFTDNSVDYDGTIDSWLWDFDDGNTSNVQNPTHSYTTLGVFNVELTVTDNHGLTDSMAKTVVINNELPVIKNVNAYPSPQTFDKDVNISCEVYDNIMVDTVKLIITYPDSSIQEFILSGDGTYQHISTYNMLGNYSFYIWANDTSGNFNTSTIYSFRIVNNPPNQPTNPTPANDSTNVDINPSLGVIVSDPDENSLFACFYDASDDSLIGIATGVASGSAASVTWSGLAYETSYSWYVVVNDTKEENVSMNWTFTTKQEPPDEPDDPPSGPPPTNNPSNLPSGTGNRKPEAKIVVDETVEFVDTQIKFDGSQSSDPDGDTLTFIWDFDDGDTGDEEIINHSFDKSGIYDVLLTVFDGSGGTDTDTVTIEILTANTEPTDPIISGNVNGKINTQYSYSAVSYDEQNDTISYYFDWNDGSYNETEFLPNGTAAVSNHSWDVSGKYVVKVNATDDKTESKTVEYNVFINTKEISYNGSEIGYLNDSDNDGFYDSFYYYSSKDETKVEYVKPSEYLIDIDDDGRWDLVHDDDTNETREYVYDSEQGGSSSSALLPFIILIILFIIILLFAPIRKKKKPAEEEQKNDEPKATPKVEKPKSKAKINNKRALKKMSGDERLLYEVHAFVDALSTSDDETSNLTDTQTDSSTGIVNMSKAKKTQSLKS